FNGQHIANARSQSHAGTLSFQRMLPDALHLPSCGTQVSRDGFIPSHRLLSLLAEEVVVDPLDRVGRHCRYADPVVQHQAPEPLAVDEDDLAVDLSGVVSRLLGEGGGGDENALLRSEALESPGELLDLGPAHRSLPPFGLEVDAVEAKAVLVNDAVDPLVAAAANGLAGIDAGAAVAHFNQEFDDETFKKGRRAGL